VAEALNNWLRRVIQAVKPFYSPEIEKGARWSSEVDEALEGTQFGIICLTPDNLNSVWIYYEAGALSKTKDALIWTFLHGLTSADVSPPLGKFQHTVAAKEDVLRLLKTINRRLADVGGEPLEDRLLEENFEHFWPFLNASLSEAENLSAAATPQTPEGTYESPREEGAKLDEILDLVRSQERRLLVIEDRISTLQPGGHILRKPFDDTFFREINFSVEQEGEKTDTGAIARHMVTDLEQLEPLANIGILEFPGRHYVTVKFAEPVSRSKAKALLDTVGRRVNYDIGGWGGTPV
jgi:hypothetical protein